jgi:hypothetical protein
MQGSLQKRSSSLPHKWQARHFVLSGKRLSYFKDAKPGRPKLKDFDLSTPNTLAFVPKNEREFELHCGKVLIILRADTVATTSTWVERIQSAVQTLPGALPPPPPNPNSATARPAVTPTASPTIASTMAATEKRQLVAEKVQKKTGTKGLPQAQLRRYPTQEREIGETPPAPSYAADDNDAAVVVQTASRGRAARKLLKKRLKMNRTRTRVVMEICSTELYYAKSLTTLCDMLIAPLRLAKPAVLDLADSQTVFMNVEQLRSLALTFSADLQKEVWLTAPHPIIRIHSYTHYTCTHCLGIHIHCTHYTLHSLYQLVHS